MPSRHSLSTFLVCLFLLNFQAAFVNAEQIEEIIDVAPVWSGHSVSFALLTHKGRQFVAFYNPDRRITVGQRNLNSKAWKFVTLPLSADKTVAKSTRKPITDIGWDSHNSLTMAVDSDNHIHLSGNMHCAPLLYFRTMRPMEIETFRWVPNMTGRREERCTYPNFFVGPLNGLIFSYRFGKSGQGDLMLNRYNTSTRLWGNLTKEPLFSGIEQHMSAYPTELLCDSTGIYHIFWVWRNSSDCATNHDVCYARSRNLRHWTASTGKALTLPITGKTAEIVELVPAGGGILNNLRVGLDSQDRPIVSYIKFDAAGNTQVYNARKENRKWNISQASDWKHRWEFSGGGSLPSRDVTFSNVSLDDQKRLVQTYRHVAHGSGLWVLDETALKPIPNAKAAKSRTRPKPPPKEVARVLEEPLPPGMISHFAGDLGRAEEPGVSYSLRWATRPANRDRPYDGPIPKPTMLRLYKKTSED